MAHTYTLPLAQGTLETVGGKGASLARLISAGLPVPDGFHVTTAAYRRFVDENDLQDRILAALESADVAQPATLETASAQIRALFESGHMPADVAAAIQAAYADLTNLQFSVAGEPRSGSPEQPARPVASEPQSDLPEQPARPVASEPRSGSPKQRTQSVAVAVRSSATAEDLPDFSFAGQQETYLNVSGVEAVRAAVQRCWASLWTARAIGYRLQHGIDQATISLAVVVQRLVPAEMAGIMFTANPMNGRREELVVNAAWGLGEAVVGGLVTPDTLVVDKATGRVLTRQTADKQVMTVLLESGTEEQPVSKARRDAPVLDDKQAADLARLGCQIEDQYGTPQDIEWCWVDGQFFIVQSRPITALPAPEPPPPTDWKLPKGAYMAMRNNIVEMMVDPLTPLFSTLGLACVNISMGRLLADFFGRPGLLPDDLIITVNEYAYYNGSFTVGQIIRILLSSVGIMKHMFTGAVERWTEIGHPRYAATVESWQAKPWREFPATDILNAARGLSEATIDAYGAMVGGVIPAAWITEGLFTLAYNALIKRRDDPTAPTYLMGFDSIPIQAEKSLYDLAEWARTRTGLATYLSETPTPQIAARLENDQAPAGVEAEDWRAWRSRFQAHLGRYGHAIYNLDFANPVPADDPAPLLEACKLFLSGQGTDPHARQQATAQRREQAVQAALERLKGLRLKLFRRTIAPAQRYAPLREDALADLGLAYPLLRQMLRELGRRFTEGRMIETPDDIFWLNQDEVEEAATRLDRGEDLDDLTAVVPQRRATWRAARQATPPMALPQIKFLGMDLGQLKTARRRGRGGDTLKGVAASPGRVTGPACVMTGPEDFAKMRTGDVLVAALTTPAWTPLFARAAAVVTDIGGPLSHGSIVAREYGIPAVLGTGAATKRIHSGQVVTVDGGAGTVTLS